MGFSAQWLALREPADLAARDPALLRAAVHAAGPAPLILDLGCGTGATARAMGRLLPADTRWRLVDKDAELLRIAAAEIGEGAETIRADLADVAALPMDGVSLVTASALLDLVSASWVEALVQRLNVPLYAALSYDGQMRWAPDNLHDKAITTAFNRHQLADKGFGPALGPTSGPVATAILNAFGFSVQQAQSPWLLGPEMTDLHRELIEGIAQAALEAGEDCAADWAQLRRSQADRTRCHIGHTDLFAMPMAKGDQNAS